MKDSPARSWAPVWVSVCLWAKLKDPSDSEQPERSTHRSSSPSRTSAKTWNHRERAWDDIEIKPTPHCKHHCSLQRLSVLRDHEWILPLLNLQTQQHNQHRNKLHSLHEKSWKCCTTSPSMLSATLMVAMRVPNDGATSESKAGVVKLNTNSVLYSARSID